MVSETQPAAATGRGPELSYTRHMAEAPTGWQHRGDYAIWGGNRTPDETPYVLHEWLERGVLPIPSRTGRPIVHRIVKGTPYHVSHLFGFWIEQDVDVMWLEAPSPGGSAYTLAAGGTVGLPAKTTSLFVCPKCAAQFGRETVPTGRQGFSSFLETALKRVRAFNADEKLRTCPKCGGVHPLSYGFYADADNDAERAARTAG
jgi:hypothetical protein